MGSTDAKAVGVSGSQFTKAVESKQVAQQDAERARFVVMKADQVRTLRSTQSCPAREKMKALTAFEPLSDWIAM